MIEVQTKERGLYPESDGMLNLRHGGHYFLEGWEGEKVRKEWYECKQVFVSVVKKLRELLRNILSFLGEVEDEIIC